jgi:CspA family cold shock protein
MLSAGGTLPEITTRQAMPRGTVKWFNDKKGFGFIVDPECGEDVFVHFSAIDANGYRSLKEGEPVEYELVKDQKGSRASKVVRACVGAA